VYYNMIVDTHVHPVATDLARYPLNPAAGEDWFKDAPMTAEMFLEQMEIAGVDQAVLVQAFTAHGYDNSYAADAAARYPDTYVAVARIDPLSRDAPDILSYWVEQRGVRGVRLGMEKPEEVDHPRSLPLWVRASQLGITVSVQLAGEARRSGLPAVARILDRFPGVNVVLDHLAHAPALDLVALARHPNLYLKFSSINILWVNSGQTAPDRRGYFERLFEAYGARRMMWGSDFPHTKGGPGGPYTELVDLARGTLSFLTPEDREEALGGTARRLYPALAS